MLQSKQIDPFIGPWMWFSNVPLLRHFTTSISHLYMYVFLYHINILPDLSVLFFPTKIMSLEHYTQSWTNVRHHTVHERAYILNHFGAIDV